MSDNCENLTNGDGSSSADTLEAAISQSLTVMSQMLANPRKITPPVLEAWVAVLRGAGLSPAEVRAAATSILATERFFPEPAVFIEKARPQVDADTLAENAWVQVRRCLREFGSYASLTAADFNGDAAALWAVGQIGLEELGEMDDRDRSIRRAEFVRYYRLARDQHYALQHLAGRFERENRAKIHLLPPEREYRLSPAMCGRPDWRETPAELPPVSEAVEMPALPPAESERPAPRPRGEGKSAGLRRAELAPAGGGK